MGSERCSTAAARQYGPLVPRRHGLPWMPHAVRPNAGLIWLTGRMTPHNRIPPTWNALTAPTGAFRSGLALGTQHLARWITPSLVRPQVDELPARSVAPVTRDLMEADETVCPRTRRVSMYEPEGDGSAAGRRSRECADLGHEADPLDGYATVVESDR